MDFDQLKAEVEERANDRLGDVIQLFTTEVTMCKKCRVYLGQYTAAKLKLHRLSRMLENRWFLHHTQGQYSYEGCNQAAREAAQEVIETRRKFHSAPCRCGLRTKERYNRNDLTGTNPDRFSFCAGPNK